MSQTEEIIRQHVSELINKSSELSEKAKSAQTKTKQNYYINKSKKVNRKLASLLMKLKTFTEIKKGIKSGNRS